MIARIRIPDGTDMMFEFYHFIEHKIENEPLRFQLHFAREGKTDYEIQSMKDLEVYLMNDEGKTIDRRMYRK